MLLRSCPSWCDLWLAGSESAWKVFGKERDSDVSPHSGPPFPISPVRGVTVLHRLPLSSHHPFLRCKLDPNHSHPARKQGGAYSKSINRSLHIQFESPVWSLATSREHLHLLPEHALIVSHGTLLAKQFLGRASGSHARVTSKDVLCHFIRPYYFGSYLTFQIFAACD